MLSNAPRAIFNYGLQMIEIKKTVIVPYTAEKMFKLVSNIENYPKALPWCSKSKIKEQSGNEVIGAIYIEYLKIKTYFVTKNINTPFSKIEIQLVEGPFHNLYGYWNFIPLGETGCKIEFSLKYKFANVLLEKVIGPVFNYISKNIIDCFIKEARESHNK
jgi:ribosome-associated toxin RatA of RatAB toxin-antitoxin module